MSELQNTVRPLPLQTTGKANIIYYFFMVDFIQADNIEVNSTELVNVEGSEDEVILQMNCSLSGNINESESKSYLIPYLTQIPSGKTLLSVSITSGETTKKGQVKGVKLKDLPVIPNKNLAETTDLPDLNQARPMVVESETTSNRYVLTFCKTTNDYSKTLGLTPVDENNLMISYNLGPDNNPPIAEENLVAAGIIDSTDLVYNHVYFDIENMSSIDYNNPEKL
tara:strand:- start:775 stop:1446 length:672 start_codon:yes stop_codon:yes gene_type:complete